MMKLLFDRALIRGNSGRLFFDHTQQIEGHRRGCRFAFLSSDHGLLVVHDTGPGGLLRLFPFGGRRHFELIDDLWISTAKEISRFQSNELLFIIFVVQRCESQISHLIFQGRRRWELMLFPFHFVVLFTLSKTNFPNTDGLEDRRVGEGKNVFHVELEHVQTIENLKTGQQGKDLEKRERDADEGLE